MSTNATSAEKRTDRTACELARAEAHDAHLLGVDTDGDTHFWSIYHQSVVVVRDGETSTIELPVATDSQPLETLGDWVAYHDWTALPGYSADSLVDDLARLVGVQ